MWFNQERGWDYKAHTLHYFTDFIWNCMLAHEQVLKNENRIPNPSDFSEGCMWSHRTTMHYPPPYRIVSDTGDSLD